MQPDRRHSAVVATLCQRTLTLADLGVPNGAHDNF